MERREGEALASPFRFPGAALAGAVLLVGIALWLVWLRAREPDAAPSAPAAPLELARGLAVSKYEELSALPPWASELRLDEGVLETTREEPARTFFSAAPGFDPPPLSVRWTVEAFRSSPRWKTVAGGETSDLKRVTIVVHEAPPEGPAAPRSLPKGRRGVLARLVFLLPGDGS
jgi:hypothetical protein